MGYSDLIRPNDWADGYSYNKESLKVYYRATIKGRKVKFSTGIEATKGKDGKLIVPKAAKDFVSEKLLQLLSDNPGREKRERIGITNPLIKDVWHEMMEERRPQKDEATMTTYHISWEHGGLSKFWGNKTVDKITGKTTKEFENFYLKKYPTRGFFNTGKHLTMLFNYCVEQKYIEEAPKLSDVDEIIRTRTKKQEVGRVYSDEEIKAILENAAKLQTRVGVRFGRYMGMRKMEILSMLKEQIDTKNWTARVWSAKNKYWREIPIPPVVRSELLELINAHPESKYLFPAPTDNNKHCSSQRFDDDWTEAKRLAGISNWDVKFAARFHDLRHTFATQTAVDNWPPLVACEVLDMSLNEYQETYGHISLKDMRRWMETSFGGAS